MLPPSDKLFLDARFPSHSVSVAAGMTCVVIPSLALPAGLSVTTSNLLLRLAPGYPDVPPDMWWFDPPVKRLEGGEIPATQAYERHLGRDWQRWSRHLMPGQWRSGTDCIESYLAIVRRELETAALKAVS
jgi:hypothetical protein